MQLLLRLGSYLQQGRTHDNEIPGHGGLPVVNKYLVQPAPDWPLGGSTPSNNPVPSPHVSK